MSVSTNSASPLPSPSTQPPEQVPADELQQEVEAILAAVPPSELRSITAKPILKEPGACLARGAGGWDGGWGDSGCPPTVPAWHRLQLAGALRPRQRLRRRMRVRRRLLSRRSRRRWAMW